MIQAVVVDDPVTVPALSDPGVRAPCPLEWLG